MEALIIAAIAAVSLAGIRQLVVMIRENRFAAAEEERRRSIPPFITVDMIVSPDGSERVRVFKRPEGTFGICLERAVDDDPDSYYSTSPGTGSVYASADIAIKEASVTIPWCNPT